MYFPPHLQVDIRAREALIKRLNQLTYSRLPQVMKGFRLGERIFGPPGIVGWNSISGSSSNRSSHIGVTSLRKELLGTYHPAIQTRSPIEWTSSIYARLQIHWSRASAWTLNFNWERMGKAPKYYLSLNWSNEWRDPLNCIYVSHCWLNSTSIISPVS